MADYGAPDSSALAGVQVNFSPGLIVAPQALTAQSGTAFDALPQISREAEYAEQSTIRYAVDRVPFQCTDRGRVSAKVADPWRLSSSLESPPAWRKWPPMARAAVFDKRSTASAIQLFKIAN